jgi:hypothetical protein
MVQFECDTCIFLKLKQRLPDPIQTQDKLLMACIRRANSDAFWSRATSTVMTNARLIDESTDLEKLVGIDPPLVPMGPLPAGDHCGYGMAVLILLKSRRPGKVSFIAPTMGNDSEAQDGLRKSNPGRRCREQLEFLSGGRRR